MKLDREGLRRWGRIAATVCRYAGVIVLIYTGTAMMATYDEFQKQVVLPLQSAVGADLPNDIRAISEGVKSAMRHMSGEDIVSALNEGREEDENLRSWRGELRIVNAYAAQLEETVIRGSGTGPMSRGPEQSYSPFDSFYGTEATSGGDGGRSDTPSSEGISGKGSMELEIEALRDWNAAMKQRNYDLLRIPPSAALYPYQEIAVALLWIGCGCLSAGLIPALLSVIARRKKRA